MSSCSRTEKQIKKNISVNKIVKVSQELGKFLPKTVFQVFFLHLRALLFHNTLRALIKFFESIKWEKMLTQAGANNLGEV